MENKLPEGMVDLGPSESLNPDSPKILDSNGQATQAQPQQGIPAVEPPVAVSYTHLTLPTKRIV